MASLMESFEQQYAALTADITAKTGRIPLLSGVEKRTAITHVEKHMEDAQELLEQMDLEVREASASERPKYLNRLKAYRAELALLEKELQRAKITYKDETNPREELFGDDYSTIEDQKQRLLDNTETIERSGRKLEGGYKLILETEQIGSNVLNELSSQRETIKRARDRLRETDEDLGKSGRIVSGMMRRILQNRLLLYVIGAVFLLVIIVGIYLTATR